MLPERSNLEASHSKADALMPPRHTSLKPNAEQTMSLTPYQETFTSAH